LTFGLSVAGFDLLPWPAVAAMILVGAISLAVYLRYAQRAPAPVLDFKLLKLPTFRASVIGGFLFRVGVGAMPFLLPLLLQVGFHLTPFQSGMITFTSTIGALIVKAAAPGLLRCFGFRTMLMANALLGGLSIAACAAFTVLTPFAVIIAMLLIGGFFRSLQFTSVNALAYAEVPQARMSRATALAAVSQQVSLATGVALGALTVELAVRLRGQGAITAADFPPGFLLVGLIAASSVLVFARLPANAAAEMANRIPPSTNPTDPRMGP
jgi:MFS family permease